MINNIAPPCREVHLTITPDNAFRGTDNITDSALSSIRSFARALKVAPAILSLTRASRIFVENNTRVAGG